MNILVKHYELSIQEVVKAGVLLQNTADKMTNPHTLKAVSDFKKNIALKGILVFNIMKTKDENLKNVMIKSRKKTYMYSFNINTEVLELKGERNNVNS